MASSSQFAMNFSTYTRDLQTSIYSSLDLTFSASSLNLIILVITCDLLLQCDFIIWEVVTAYNMIPIVGVGGGLKVIPNRPYLLMFISSLLSITPPSPGLYFPPYWSPPPHVPPLPPSSIYWTLSPYVLHPIFMVCASVSVSNSN